MKKIAKFMFDALMASSVAVLGIALGVVAAVHVDLSTGIRSITVDEGAKR